MCMRLSKAATTKLRNRMLANGRRLTCHKVYKLCKGSLQSPIFLDRRSSTPKAGWLQSDRLIQEAGQDTSDWSGARPGGEAINRGIHVLTSISAARRCACRWADEIIVPVQCHLKDLVGGGTLGEAVFMKVRILKKDFEAAVKGNGNG